MQPATCDRSATPRMLSLLALMLLSAAFNVSSAPVQADIGLSYWHRECMHFYEIVVGRKHQGDEQDPADVLCAPLTYKGETPDFYDREYPELTESGHEFVSPQTQFITGIELRGDENDPMRYTTTKIRSKDGDILAYRPVGSWVKVDEHAHEFRCPQGQALIARSHFGDEKKPTYYACGKIWGHSAPLPTPIGTLSFLNHKNIPCQVPVPNTASGTVWTYSFAAQNSACAKDAIRGMLLDKVQSSVKILLTDDDLCNKGDNFWIELRTKDKSTTVDQELKIADILTYQKNTVIRAGLVLTDFYHKPGTEADHKLSCVQFTTSGVP